MMPLKDDHLCVIPAWITSIKHLTVHFFGSHAIIILYNVGFWFNGVLIKSSLGVDLRWANSLLVYLDTVVTCSSAKPKAENPHHKYGTLLCSHCKYCYYVLNTVCHLDKSCIAYACPCVHLAHHNTLVLLAFWMTENWLFFNKTLDLEVS